MARTEKKTKIRYLPPKAQLTQRDSVTGSFPTVARTAVVDNRDGRNRSFYDDSNTQVFSNTSVPVMSTPVMSESFQSQFRKNPGQELQPFRDSGQEAADGKGSSDPFWSTGSDFDGLRDPLWSKHKIEIDITPQTQTTITANDTSGYVSTYNFETKQWAQTAGDVASQIYQGPGKYSGLTYGFTPSYHTRYAGGFGGKPFSNFGFPWSVQVPNQSLFKMSTVIDRPFLLEKVVVKISASYIKGVNPTQYDDASDIDGGAYYSPDISSTSLVTNNFYILNQRADYKDGKKIYSYFEGDFGPERSYLQIAPVNKTNDMVTWFNILSYNTGAGNSTLFDGVADVIIFDPISSNSYFSSWSQDIHMSGAVRIPNYGSTEIGTLMIDTSDDLYLKYFFANWAGGRNGTDGVTPNGRDFVNATKSDNNSTSPFTISPYLLMPGDALSFNWQMPMPETVSGGPFNPSGTDTSALIFAQHPAKVILYGTYLSENKGTGDTLNQLLSSETIHEAL